MIFVLRFFLVSGLFTALFSASIHARTLDEIISSKELRVCLVTNIPSMATATPKGCSKNCSFRGPNYDLSLAFAHSLGKEVHTKFRKVGWNEQFHNQEGKTVRSDSYTPKLLASGACDVFPNNMTENTWRLKKLDFILLFPSKMMVVVHKSQKRKFRRAKDLAGKQASVSENSSYHTWIDAQNKSTYAQNPIQLKLQPSNLGLKELAQKKVDFTLADANAAIWTTRHEYPELAAAFPVGKMDKIGWGFRKSDTKLQKAATQFLKAQRKEKSSEVNQIWKKYYGMTLTRFISLVSVIR